MPMSLLTIWSLFTTVCIEFSAFCDCPPLNQNRFLNRRGLSKPLIVPPTTATRRASCARVRGALIAGKISALTRASIKYDNDDI